jgi:hypothetical protein
MLRGLVDDGRTIAPIAIDLSGVDSDAGSGGIRCPVCAWRPSPASRWRCECGGTPEPPFAACGTVWNTFETRGRCPGCQHQWQWTTCHDCLSASPHEDWYAGTGDAP